LAPRICTIMSRSGLRAILRLMFLACTAGSIAVGCGDAHAGRHIERRWRLAAECSSKSRKLRQRVTPAPLPLSLFIET
jgi:hypothetical protein